jgi:hypothetical protein
MSAYLESDNIDYSALLFEGISVGSRLAGR